MKTIYDIYEGLLDDMEEVLANTENDVREIMVVQNFLSNDKSKQELAYNTLKEMISRNNVKQHNSTSRVKWADSWFVQFNDTKKFLNKLVLFKRNGGYGFNVITLFFFGDKLQRNTWSFDFFKSLLSPNSCELYEIPKNCKELQDICEELYKNISEK